MKKMKDSCFNEFDPNAMSVEAALESILKSIERGPKRKIEKIIIEASDKQKSVSHSVNNWDKKTREELKITYL